MTILLLPFAAPTEGDEVSAKLGRQIPRLLGTEIEEATEGYGLKAKYLSSRGSTPDGSPAFVVGSAIQTGGELNQFAEMYGANLAMAGSLRLGEREIRLEVQLFEVAKKASGFAKVYETFPSYIFDALEEIKLRTTQLLGIELTDEERVKLFRRPTESWQAYLFFALAEDERYGFGTGMLPKHLIAPLDLYREAIEVDQGFTKASDGLNQYFLMLAESEKLQLAEFQSAVKEYRKYLSEDVLEVLTELAGL